MQAPWNFVLQSLIKAVKPKQVLCLGSEIESHQDKLAEAVCSLGSQFTLVGSKTSFDHESLKRKHGPLFQLVQNNKPSSLENYFPADLVFIRGASNWFTVFNHLKLVENLCDKGAYTFPVVAIFNTGWPYGRRDSYGKQSDVPTQFKRPHKTGGLIPGSNEVHLSAGFDLNTEHAINEGGSQNGVLTAIDEFLNSASQELSLSTLEGLHGLSLVYSQKALFQNSDLTELVKDLSPSPIVAKHLAEVEKQRVLAEVEKASLINLVNRQVERQDLETDKLQKVANKAPALFAEVQSLKHSLASSENQLTQRDRQFESLEEQNANLIESDRQNREKLTNQAKEAQQNLSTCYQRLLSEHQRTLWHCTSAITRCLEEAFRLLQTIANSKKYRYSTGVLNRQSHSHVQAFTRDCETALNSWNSHLRLAESKELLRARLSEEDRILERLHAYHSSLPEIVVFTKLILGQLETILSSKSYRLGSFLFDSAKGKSLLSKGYVKSLPELKLEQIRGSLDHWGNLYLGLPSPLGGFREFENGAKRIKLKDKLTVVLPVYNALEDVVRCIESLLRHQCTDFQLLILDDCSPDPNVEPKLKAYAEAEEWIHYLRNNKNQGYTKNINIGCRIAPADIILLNSDTIVTERWIEKLRAAAYSDQSIATVTPVSNGAGAFSVPINNQVNKIPEDSSVDEISSNVEKLSPLLRPEVPTGNGFCLYIKSTAFNKIGFFDENRFPRGYGEENDFCIRLNKAGLKNIIDDQTYIYHKRSASFGSEKAELIEKSKAVIRELHPEYSLEVRRWLANDPVDQLRSRLTCKTASPTKKNILYVLHDGGGGTIETSQDLALGIDSSFQPYILFTGRKQWKLFRREAGELKLIRLYQFQALWQVDNALDQERQNAWKGIIDLCPWQTVHVRHFLGNAPELASDLKARDIPLIVSLHDYYTISPCLQLISREGKYLSEQELKDTPPKDQFLTSNWFKGLDSQQRSPYLLLHLERFLPALNYAKTIITTDQSPKDIFSSYFPKHISEKIIVIPHGRNLAFESKLKPSLRKKPWKVLVLGNINISKGEKLFSEILAENERIGRPFEFHFLGAMSGEMMQIAQGHHIHGTYQREELRETVANISPHISLIASVWPETFCHTLTESWSLGLPVLSSNLGAPNNRILSHGGGWLLEPKSGKAWLNKLEDIFSQPEDYDQKVKAASSYRSSTIEEMSSEYQRVYAGLQNSKTLRLANF